MVKMFHTAKKKLLLFRLSILNNFKIIQKLQNEFKDLEHVLESTFNKLGMPRNYFNGDESVRKIENQSMLNASNCND